MEIAEAKDISIKTPVHNHNPQRQGLEDNLFDFGDALLDYTSDGGTIRINQGLATFMLIAATAEVPNKLLMERKREAFEQVTAQAQDLALYDLLLSVVTHLIQDFALLQRTQRGAERQVPGAQHPLKPAQPLRHELVAVVLNEDPVYV